MGTGDGSHVGSVRERSRGRKISFLAGLAARIAASRQTFGNSSHGECAKTRQIEILAESPLLGARMSAILRKPSAAAWILSISQAAAMLAFNLLLRAAVL